MSPRIPLKPIQAKMACLTGCLVLLVQALFLNLAIWHCIISYLNPTPIMNPRQMFINTIHKIKSLGTDTYRNLSDEEKQTQQYQKFSPELRTMIEAMANQESVNGQFREKKGDQADGSNSYGLLHMGQGAVDQWNKLSGERLKAKDLAGPESDAKQKFIQASRINRDMQVNGRDLMGATRFIQNQGDPNYATTTLNKYKQTGKAVQDVVNMYPNAVKNI